MNVEKAGGINVIDEVNAVNKTNTRVSKSRIRFFILGLKLAFAKLRKTFSTALILHHFALNSHIWIETDTLGNASDRIFNQ